ncbi:MAG: terminase large subunit domain-containing protein [bacterium]
MMAHDIARTLDPVLLAQDCGIEPDPWQADLLRKMPRRALLLCSRQSGKSTVTGLMALHTAIYQPGALVILVSPSQRQSGELFRTVVGFHARVEGAPQLTAESTMRAELANGSRIIALPGTDRTIRGYAAADLVVVDEAARVEDELLTAVRPMLATSGGHLIALTTPAGRRGWFFEAWTGAGDWHRVRVAASDCPRITEEFLAEELRELGAIRFSEEYGLEFRDSEEAVFPAEIIARAFTTEVQPLWM